MFARLLIVVLCFGPLAIAPAVANVRDQQQQISVTGLYHSNWDDVRLEQDGDRVYGTYVCCGRGTIEGRIIDGKTLRYRWKQPGGEGRGVWTIRAGRLDGTWGWNNASDGGRWDLALASSRGQIAN